MSNKIQLIVLFLLVGWITYQQIQITNKTSESENISSELIDERIRFLKLSDFTLNDAFKKIEELENKILANTNNYNKLIAELFKTDKASESENISSEVIDERIRFLKASEFTLNDANKKIQVLETKMLANTNNYNKLTTKINEIQSSLNNYMKKQDSTNKKITSITDSLNSTNQKMKNAIINVSEHIPQTYFYGPYNSLQQWSWVNTPVDRSFIQHPNSTKLTIAKRSLVTLSINGHIHTKGQCVQVLFFIDNKPIPVYSDVSKSHYNTYLTCIDNWASLDLVQETIVQSGSYVFEFGIYCHWCLSQSVQINGAGYTIKVEELPDPIIITNQNF